MNKSYSFLFRYLKPHLILFFSILFLGILSMAFALISPLITKVLIDKVFLGKDISLFFNIIFFVIGIYLISSISIYFHEFFSGKLQNILFKDISIDSFDILQLVSLKNINNMKTGDVITRILGNTQILVDIPVNIFPQLIISTVTIVAPVFIMISLNWQLALIVMSPTFLFILSSLYFGKTLEKTQLIFLESNGQVYSFLKEFLPLIQFVKVFDLRKWVNTKFNKEMNDYYDSSMKFTQVSSLNSSISSLIFSVPIILLIIFGGPMVIKGTLTLGTFTAFVSYISIFFSPISQLSHLWNSYKSALPALDRVTEIFELETDIDKNGVEKLKLSSGEIHLDNIHFSYSENKKILHGFNATFKNGVNYLIGENGSGKSTILKLLCNLYNPNQGNITIDGQDISNIRKKDLRKNISMIFSDPHIFDGTIYENIHIGNLSASYKDVIKTAQLVEIHNFIKTLPEGYDTNVGENGSYLSSGEKQKIAIARVLLRDSPIILLDEATKSIDINSRNLIKGIISKLSNKTIIIASHQIDEIDQNGNIIYLKN
ncbi:ABC transporter ATP-binding protein [Methanobacterium movens]|jgi:ABC-type bacteriocin/lantibiotic exporter with double-glycine peptidase domain